MRIIFSVYIDFDKNDFESNDDFDKNVKSKSEFKNNYSFLKSRQEEYAEKIGVKYILYENDDKWKDYRNYFEENYPFAVSYTHLRAHETFG